MSRAIQPDTPYLERVTQLIPAEIVAAHLTIQGLVFSRILIRDLAIEISAVCLLVILPFYLARVQSITSKRQILLTMGSFVVWVVAVSLPVYQRVGMDPAWGSVILILWTIAIPPLASPSEEV